MKEIDRLKYHEIAMEHRFLMLNAHTDRLKDPCWSKRPDFCCPSVYHRQCMSSLLITFEEKHFSSIYLMDWGGDEFGTNCARLGALLVLSPACSLVASKWMLPYCQWVCLGTWCQSGITQLAREQPEGKSCWSAVLPQIFLEPRDEK